MTHLDMPWNTSPGEQESRQKCLEVRREVLLQNWQARWSRVPCRADR